MEALSSDGQWQTIWQEMSNHQRVLHREVDTEARAVRLVVEETWGDPEVTVFEWDAS